MLRDESVPLLAATFAPTAVGIDVARAALAAAERVDGESGARSDGGAQSSATDTDLRDSTEE